MVDALSKVKAFNEKGNCKQTLSSKFGCNPWVRTSSTIRTKSHNSPYPWLTKIRPMSGFVASFYAQPCTNKLNFPCRFVCAIVCFLVEILQEPSNFYADALNPHARAIAYVNQDKPSMKEVLACDITIWPIDCYQWLQMGKAIALKHPFSWPARLNFRNGYLRLNGEQSQDFDITWPRCFRDIFWEPDSIEQNLGDPPHL